MDATELQRVFSRNLKNARNRERLSQLKLAEKANLSVGYICDLESGRRWGTPETFSKLAQALHINAYELLLPPLDSTAPEQPFRHEYLSALHTTLQNNIDTAVHKAISETFFAVMHA